MKVSTRGRYGTRLLLDVALNQDKGSVLLKDVAARQGIPFPYLKHLISPLQRGGILRTARGANGGVHLARPPEDISMLEVVQLLEGDLSPVECVNEPKLCDHASLCVTRDIWFGMEKAVRGALKGLTLRDLLERHKDRASAVAGMYYI